MTLCMHMHMLIIYIAWWMKSCPVQPRTLSLPPTAQNPATHKRTVAVKKKQEQGSCQLRLGRRSSKREARHRQQGPLQGRGGSEKDYVCRWPGRARDNDVYIKTWTHSNHDRLPKSGPFRTILDKSFFVKGGHRDISSLKIWRQHLMVNYCRFYGNFIPAARSNPF